MNQDDYKTEFEEHREEIKLDELNHSTAHLPSRSERYRKKRPKRKSRHRLINTILGLFILIPLIILIIVIYDYYNPEYNTAAGDSGIVMEPPGADDSNNGQDVDIIINDSDKEGQEPSNKQPVSGIGSKAVDENEEDTSSGDELVNAGEKQNSSQDGEEPSSQIHTVSKGETIFRISVIYYKNGSGVDKIKEANGLSSNHIIEGQKLIIP